MSSEVAGGLYYDRLSGRGARLPETKGTLVGRWVLHPDKGSNVFLNSAPVVRGDFLVPEASGLWCVLEAAGKRTEGSVVRRQLPEDIEAESIRTIGERLANFKAERKNWLDWTDVVPLVPGMSDEVEIKPLDQKIREHFGHLEAVCFKPRAHLHVEVERVPVSKARRIAPAAAAYLASHTEDWDRPLIRGILPKRILSEVRHDQIDIYENRVAARLLDHLTVYLGRRIQKLRKLLKMFQEKEDYTSGATGGTYQRRGRIMALWGESIDANEGRRKAEATLKELDWLKYKLMGLVDTPLYRSVPRRSYVPTTLRMTNILANDQHYRRVSELWREWADTGAGHVKSPQELNAEAQELCRGMDSFSMLLVVRALEMLGYEPQSADWEASLAPGTTIRLQGHGVSLSALWQADGTILIQTEDDSLRFLPLAFDLGGANNEEQAQAALDRICGSALKTSSKLTVLYAASSDEAKGKLSLDLRQALHTVGNDPRTNVSKVGVLPVSPWEIGSTERVARALRWFITSARFNGYPWTIDVPPEALNGFAFEKAQWLAGTNRGRSIELIRPPQEYEWEQFSVESVVVNANAALKTAQQSREQISTQLRRAVRAGGAGDLNRRKREAQQAIIKAEGVLEAIEAVAKQLVAAQSRSGALLQCPTCGESADAIRDFEPRDHGCFRCHCPGCKTAWATRLCGAGHKYAVMLPSGDFVDTEDTQPGWEDRVYGGDLLALPARTNSDEWGFACPDCGEIT